MKNSFGNNLKITIFGESHGPAIGAVIDGLASGVKIDGDYISKKLSKRRPSGQISTARQEADNFEILSGVKNGYSCGTPICIMIRNSSQHSADYNSCCITNKCCGNNGQRRYEGIVLSNARKGRKCETQLP